MPLSGWNFHRNLTDGNGTSLANFPCRVALTSTNFDFAKAKADGSDLRVRDETTGTILPIWVQDYNSTAQSARIHYLAADTSHAHTLYFGNASATAVSNFAAVYTHGSGFDANWGDLSTTIAGTYGEATRLAAPANASDPNGIRTWRLSTAPIFQISEMTSAGIPLGNYTGLREYCLLKDDQNRALLVAGKYHLFFVRRPSTATDHHQTWHADSSSPYGPWANFVKIFDPPAGIRLGYPGGAIKIGSTYYVYITYGWSDGGGGSTPGLSIYYMTSLDLVTWSGVTQCLTPGVFNDQTSGACTDIGNPKVIRITDGRYVMSIEGQNIANGHWACYLATSSDGIVWTPVSASPVVVNGAAGTWDANAVANPSLWQFPSGSFAIQYNGFSNGTNGDGQLGWATSSSLGGAYTKAVWNPYCGRPYGAYGVEVAHFGYEADGQTLINVCQRFNTDSNTGSFYKLTREPREGGILLSRDNPATGAVSDGSLAGLVLTGNWTVEVSGYMTAHREDGATPNILSVFDSAAVPSPGTKASFDASKLQVIEIFRWGHSVVPSATASPGAITFSYHASDDTRYFWNGSGWSSAFTGRAIAALVEDEITVTLSFDGTNYVMKAVKASDGSTIAAPTPVAAASMRSTSLGTCVMSGDPYTDVWESGAYLRSFTVRPYAATEPAISLGTQVQDQATWYTFTPPSPASGVVNQESAPFTVTPDGPYTGTITISPTGGGMSAATVLTFSSAAPQTFTITPLAPGTITLTPSNSGGLPNPAAVTYTANPAVIPPTTWNYMSTTAAFAADRASSMGYTVYLPTGAILYSRATTGIVRIGNLFVAMVSIPWVGAVLVDWDDGNNHDVEPITEIYVEPGLTFAQSQAEILAAATGKTSDGGLKFYAPDGTTLRLNGTVSGGDRLTSVLTPPT